MKRESRLSTFGFTKGWYIAFNSFIRSIKLSVVVVRSQTGFYVVVVVVGIKNRNPQITLVGKTMLRK